jgi:hypothetical protein
MIDTFGIMDIFGFTHFHPTSPKYILLDGSTWRLRESAGG